MQHRQIINVITFLRGSEPRSRMDLLKSMKKQMKLLDENKLPATFLFQYDALIRKDFIKLAKKYPQFEYGVWLEMNKPHVEAAGLTWMGRYSWDWHAHCAMPVGYTKEDREKLVDAIFEKFKSIFGKYPRVLGTWVLDAHSLAYADEKYGLDGACNCRDQWGTDGYNLWGGYYGQGYYPSVTNGFAPANSFENQLKVPIFRMLGSDPILQYDVQLDLKTGAKKQDDVITLEPVYTKEGGGGRKKWTDWFMRENFNDKCLSFGYAQAGQENSFSWRKAKRGLRYQYPLFAKLREEGKIEVETLGETGKWFKSRYVTTPASTIVAENDWLDKGKKSYWYCCKNYRVNLLIDEYGIRFRDCFLFRDGYRESYWEDPCVTDWLTRDNLPVMDGLRFSGNGVLAGAYIYYNGAPLRCDKVRYEEKDGKAVLYLLAKEPNVVKIEFSEKGVTIGNDVDLKIRYSGSNAGKLVSASLKNNNIKLQYNDYEYNVAVDFGMIKPDYSITGKFISIRLDQ